MQVLQTPSYKYFIALLFVNVCCAQTKSRANEVDTSAYREKVKRMFYHAYDGYLKYAYPYDELKPLTCKGHDTWGSYSLTLIDAMDTLAVMGNYSEFRRIANLVIDKGENAFDMDINVSVFETNIRIVGGLISAHLLMKRAGMQLEEAWPCSGPLLRMADSIARKLLPAFDTPTGMPYGTVNLRNGVPKGETSVTCTAGVGTFVIEFGTLSRLTGDPIFEKTAVRAIRSLWKYRSPLGLLGNHIDVKTGKWTAQDAGIGGGVDSYFEYLVKGSILFNLPELTHLFREYEVSIRKYLKKDDWYMWAQMNKGTITLPMFTSLDAFWPSIQMMLGDIDGAMKTLHNFHMVWRQFGFTPEYYNIPKSEAHKGREGYPLRPELIESIMYLYRATKDPSLLRMGVDIVEAIEREAKTECGYATIKDVRDHRLDDRMESFFLAETAKYLYLLFDTDNFIHNNGSHGQVIDTPSGSCVIEAGGYVFNTEAHPIDLAAVHCCSAKKLEEDKLLEDFHSNLDLLSLLNMVDGEDEIIGMKNWRHTKSKKSKGDNSNLDKDEKLDKKEGFGAENMKINIGVDKGKKNSDKNTDNSEVDLDKHPRQESSNLKHEIRNGNLPGINLEVALPSGPARPDVDENTAKSSHKLLTKSNLSEMQKNIVKILMESLHINADEMSFVDIAAKLESEFKGTKYEKIAQHLVEQILEEGIEMEAKSRKAKIANADKGQDEKVIPEVVAQNDEGLEKLLSEISSIINETVGDKTDGGASVSRDKIANDSDKGNENHVSESNGRNKDNLQNSSKEITNSKTAEVGSDDSWMDHSNPVLERLIQHLESQEKDNERSSENRGAESTVKATFLESRRLNLLSLTRKFLKVFTSLASGQVVDGVGDSDKSSQDSSPSLANLYAVLGKQSLQYFHDPNIMHCPAQSFHSRLSVNGEFLVDE